MLNHTTKQEGTMQTTCIHCRAVVETELGAVPPNGEKHEGSVSDPRPPGDWDNICDVCNYRDGKRGGPIIDDPFVD